MSAGAGGTEASGETDDPFPWGEILAFGFGVLRLAPRDFWQMTPRELSAAIDGVTGRRARALPMSRRDLLHLCAQFPDKSGGLRSP